MPTGSFGVFIALSGVALMPEQIYSNFNTIANGPCEKFLALGL